MTDFKETRNILNRRPSIEFVEPDQIAGEQEPIIEEAIADQLRNKALELRDQYSRIEKLTDIAQKRIDARAKNMSVNLDPVKDVSTCQAMQRVFGTDIDKCTITYDQYREALDTVCKASEDKIPGLTQEGLRNAIRDPFKKNLGGSGGPGGSLRSEIQLDKLSGGSPIDPIDVDKYKRKQIVKLIKDLVPGLTPVLLKLIRKEITKAFKKDKK